MYHTGDELIVVCFAAHDPQEAPKSCGGTAVSREWQKATPVIAVAGHDTLSAFAAVPCPDGEAPFLSCGTWAVMGFPLEKSVRTHTAIADGFINEPGYKSVILAKNMLGLHLFGQYFRRAFAVHKGWTYNTLANTAVDAKPFGR